MNQKPHNGKAELRRTYRELRASMGEEARVAADAAIARRVMDLPAFQDADIVFTYLSFGEEVDTRALIEEAWRLGKTVALPRVTGMREMRWFAVEGFDGLETSRYGIDEPPMDETREVLPRGRRDGDDDGDGGGAGSGASSDGRPRAIAIVPALTFDPQGYRIGYGGGFYDAFLGDFVGTSIGLCRARQMSREPLPHDAHDVPVDLVVCG